MKRKIIPHTVVHVTYRFSPAPMNSSPYKLRDEHEDKNKSLTIDELINHRFYIVLTDSCEAQFGVLQPHGDLPYTTISGYYNSLVKKRIQEYMHSLLKKTDEPEVTIDGFVMWLNDVTTPAERCAYLLKKWRESPSDFCGRDKMHDFVESMFKECVTARERREKQVAAIRLAQKKRWKK
jgi:hypothetical protein